MTQTPLKLKEVAQAVQLVAEPEQVRQVASQGWHAVPLWKVPGPQVKVQMSLTNTPGQTGLQVLLARMLGAEQAVQKVEEPEHRWQLVSQALQLPSR